MIKILFNEVIIPVKSLIFKVFRTKTWAVNVLLYRVDIVFTASCIGHDRKK